MTTVYKIKVESRDQWKLGDTYDPYDENRFSKEDVVYFSNCGKRVEEYIQKFITKECLKNLTILKFQDEQHHKTSLRCIYEDLNDKDQSLNSGVLSTFIIESRFFSSTNQHKITVTKILIDQ
jgi:hypothetical protein